MISQMASFYAVVKSRKSVDNIRVAEIHFFSEGRILELKPQMKHSFAFVPDEEHALCLLHYEACQ